MALAKVVIVDHTCQKQRATMKTGCTRMHTASSAATKAAMLIRHRVSSLKTGPSSSSSSKPHPETTRGILHGVDIAEAKKLEYSLTIIHGGGCLMMC